MTESNFTPNEFLQYHRHLVLDGFGEKAQAKLKSSKVLVVGAGGLGCPSLLYLAAAGVGHIGIIDFDTIDLSNLQRQIIYGTAEIGQLKVNVAATRLLEINPNIQISKFPVRLTSKNAIEILSPFDLVIDGSDNFPTRYLVNDACVILGIPNIYGSVSQYEGQVSVFNYTSEDGFKGPNYRDLFPLPPQGNLINNCAEAGVLGVVTGIIGAMQANEAIKVITGIGNLLNGRLYIFDALSFESRLLKITKQNPSSIITELIDYELFCNTKAADIPSISAEIFHEWQQSNKDFQLIDVREPSEAQANTIGGVLIPMESIKDRITEIQRDKTLVVHCETGVRSLEAVKLLKEHGFTNVYHLEGGMRGLKRKD